MNRYTAISISLTIRWIEKLIEALPQRIAWWQ
jgi:hypothetical protein